MFSIPIVAVAILFILVSFLPFWLEQFIIADSTNGVLDDTSLSMINILQTLPRYMVFIFLSFIPLMLVYQYFYYKTYFYDFSSEGAKISKGIFKRSTGYVTYDKILNIYLDQDPLDKMFGLYDAHFETAATESGSYSHVDGLDKENAEKLIYFLNKNCNKIVIKRKK